MATTNRPARQTYRAARKGQRRPVYAAGGHADAALPHDGAAPRTAEQPHQKVRAHAWDGGLFFCVLLLMAVGLIALYSASYSVGLHRFGSPVYFIKNQFVNAVLGIGAMIVISRIPYKLYARWHQALMVVSIILLILVAIPGVGEVRNHARRWLFGFQPSEIAKLAVIICFAYWIARDTKSVRSLKGLIKPYGLLLAAYVVLLALEPHTSGMLIICGIGVIILVAGGMRLWYFIPIGVLGVGVVTAFYFMFEHVRTRFAVWLNPFLDMSGDGYQGAMSQIAIGSGGFFGLGLGNGRQKHLYLPEPQNDFIFAAWCEEMGFIGALIVILMFACLIYRGFVIARAAPDKFSAMVATGITAKLAIQTLMNLYVVTGIIPVTGASLPFFSYGGTALLMQLGEMGILLNISRYMRIDVRQSE
ncbi:MAG: putative lipid II flippase FtsW [Agathobaculum sp.]|jgi:cell division protein FtsW|uniref:putative lipid II flippase FtsW n=1 Tax=Agathobaculum sp. TaxID=2048138 RepID=UPI003D8BE04C